MIILNNIDLILVLYLFFYLCFSLFRAI